MDYKNHKAAVYTNATVEEVEFLVAGWVGFAVIHLHTHFTCCIEINDHVCPHTSLLLLFTAFIHRICILEQIILSMKYFQIFGALPQAIIPKLKILRLVMTALPLLFITFHSFICLTASISFPFRYTYL